MKMVNVDIAIVGAGMVGLTLAAALANSKLRIAIIEKSLPAPIADPALELRVSAINRASENLLRNLGAWAHIPAERIATYQQMQVWEQDSFAEIGFDAHDIAQPDLGHIIENKAIQLGLLEKVKQQANVQLFCPESCNSLMQGESEVWLALASGKGISAKLIVGADGAHSWLRQQCAIPMTAWDYDHSALIAQVRTELPHQHIARQIFAPQGPLAFLPLNAPNLCSIVWSLPPEQAEHYRTCAESEFNNALMVAFDSRLGRCELGSERLSLPLSMRYARDFIQDRVALIGDAAHSIHPLAGQGINLGLLDAAALAEQLLQLEAQGKDIGAKANLRYFERWRKTEAAHMIASMQAFHALFAGEQPAKKLIRDLGMLAAAHLPWVKQKLIKQALGIKADLPALCYPQSS